MPNDPFNTLRSLEIDGVSKGLYYSLPALEEAGHGGISRLPVSIRLVLESVLRNCDGSRVNETDVKRLASWDAKSPSLSEVPFVVSKLSLQEADFYLTRPQPALQS